MSFISREFLDKSRGYYGQRHMNETQYNDISLRKDKMADNLKKYEERFGRCYSRFPQHSIYMKDVSTETERLKRINTNRDGTPREGFVEQAGMFGLRNQNLMETFNRFADRLIPKNEQKKKALEEFILNEIEGINKQYLSNRYKEFVDMLSSSISKDLQMEDDKKIHEMEADDESIIRLFPETPSPRGSPSARSSLNEVKLVLEDIDLPRTTEDEKVDRNVIPAVSQLIDLDVTTPPTEEQKKEIGSPPLESPPKEKKSTVSEMSESYLDRVYGERLKEEEIKEFPKLVDNMNDEDIQELIRVLKSDFVSLSDSDFLGDLPSNVIQNMLKEVKALPKKGTAKKTILKTYTIEKWKVLNLLKLYNKDIKSKDTTKPKAPDQEFIKRMNNILTISQLKDFNKEIKQMIREK